ncbi:ABC transporter ATP-binding protein [Roseiarcus sp.]|uniref:ABC transporter ATP-binding protein n=1 Tax=Roseiarcus sp. TaxID=1969460 RepID=UPI003F9734D0
MAFLEITGLSKSFKQHEVIRDLSVAIEKGEFLVIFGPSGCGKTVLLRLIAGMMQPDAGDIVIDGRSVVDLNPENRDIGMAFQNYALYPHMTAYENIASPLRSRHVPEAEVGTRVHDTARMLRIDHVLDHLPKALSQGQKQRTALARSLVGRPSVVLLDDPLRNVDAKIRYEMRFELPRVLRRYEATVIYVTQDYKEAMALGDRVAVLVDGAFRQVAHPHEVYDAPGTTRIARLFGDPPINLVPVQPVTAAGGVEMNVAGGTVRLPADSAAVAGRDCTFGIRSEDIWVSLEPTEGLPVTLEAITPVNNRLVMLLRGDEGTELFASCPQGSALDHLRGRHKAWATMDLARAHFFDHGDGVRI